MRYRGLLEPAPAGLTRIFGVLFALFGLLGWGMGCWATWTALVEGTPPNTWPFDLLAFPLGIWSLVLARRTLKPADKGITSALVSGPALLVAAVAVAGGVLLMPKPAALALELYLIAGSLTIAFGHLALRRLRTRRNSPGDGA